MPSIYRRAGRWRAEVRRAGFYRSDTFPTRAEAFAWAAQVEADYADGKAGRGTSHTLRHVLERYRDEVSVRKGGVRWEQVRINALLNDWKDWLDRPMAQLTAADFIEWRDARRRKVSDATVRRDMALLRSIVAKAHKDWRYLGSNPLAEVTRPKDAPARTRRVSLVERAALAEAAGWKPGTRPTTHRQRVVIAFELAIETGMRAGEIMSLTAETVDLARSVAHLAKTKNGDARDVPLSSAARALIGLLLPAEGSLVGMSEQARDVHFRRLREIAANAVPGIKTLRFHDSRHEACTQLAQRLSLLDLARVIGHRDPRSLLRYFNPTPEEIAKRLG